MVASINKYPKLRGRIIEKFGSYAAFADYIDEHRTVVSRKLNGDIGFTKADIVKWSQVLDIELSEYGIYFFVEQVN